MVQDLCQFLSTVRADDCSGGPWCQAGSGQGNHRSHDKYAHLMLLFSSGSGGKAIAGDFGGCVVQTVADEPAFEESVAAKLGQDFGSHGERDVVAGIADGGGNTSLRHHEVDQSGIVG